AESTRALHPDAVGTGALSVLYRSLHGASERDAVGELVGNALGDQGGVELGLLDLDDVELHLGVAGDRRDHRPQLVGLDAPPADDDAGTCRVDIDPNLVAGALDLDAADGRRLEPLHDGVADLPVFGEVLGVLTLAEPAALPVGDD